MLDCFASQDVTTAAGGLLHCHAVAEASAMTWEAYP